MDLGDHEVIGVDRQPAGETTDPSGTRRSVFHDVAMVVTIEDPVALGCACGASWTGPDQVVSQECLLPQVGHCAEFFGELRYTQHGTCAHDFDPLGLICSDQDCLFAVKVFVALSSPVCCCPVGIPGALTADGSTGGGAWGGHTPTAPTAFDSYGLIQVTATGRAICAPSGPFSGSVTAYVRCEGSTAAHKRFWTRCGKCG